MAQTVTSRSKSSITPAIRVLTESDLPSVADIHIVAFPDSLLTQIGKRVVNKYYEWQLQPPNECLAIGAFDDEILVGYCFSGVFWDAEVYFVVKHWHLAVPHLIKNPGLLRQINPCNRIIYIIKAMYKKLVSNKGNLQKSTSHLRKYGILSIAVSPTNQRFGVGKQLIQAVYEDAIKKGYDLIQLSVHPDNQKAVHFYEKEGWVRHLDNDGKWSGVMITNLQVSK